MGALAKKLSGRGRMIFDIRGFMPEEYTDAGVWPENGYLYRGVKRVERYLFAASDGFVVLTERAREILFPGFETNDRLGRPIEVIPCCVDPARFRAAEETSRDDLRLELKLTNRRVIVYVGSFGGWYMTDEMTRFLALAHQQDPRTFALILTQSPPEPVRERLRSLGFEDDDFFVGKVAAPDVPRYLKASDVAISFIKACYSKLSSSPTKIAEYLASGLPVVCNSGVGDLDEVITTDRVGVLIQEFTPTAYAQALTELESLRQDEMLTTRCRATANERFNLETVGGFKYRRLYRRLLDVKRVSARGAGDSIKPGVERSGTPG
jgi:glycosyltransferase involved in cell wall biosynthesis